MLTVSKFRSPDGQIVRLTLDWTSDAGGVVLAAIGATLGDIRAVRGLLSRVETIPGLEGDLTTNLPNDQYDIALLTPYGADLVDGNCGNRSGIIADTGPIFATPIPNIDEIRLNINNAGALRSGRINLYFLVGGLV